MNMTEIETRERRVNDAKQKLLQAKKALQAAREEFAEQEARKAGITYNVTKVRVPNKTDEVYLVVGIRGWFRGPCYDLRKITKDGTASKFRAYRFVKLHDLEIVEGRS